MWIKFLLPILAFVFSSPSFGDEPKEMPEFLLQSSEPLVAAEHEKIILNYNSDQYDSTLLDGFTKAELIYMIRTNTPPMIKKGEKPNGFSVPFGPTLDWSVESATADLEKSLAPERKATLNEEIKNYQNEFSRESISVINENLDRLTDTELKLFLSKKHDFLLSIGSRLEKTFKFFRIRIPYKFIQNTLNSLNTVFFQKSEQFVKSNSQGIPIFIQTGIGASTGRLFYDFIISKTPLKNVIKSNFGFYLSTAFGIGISRVVVDNKTSWVLDMFVDFEHLKRAFLPILEVSASAGLGFYIESRTLPENGRRFYLSNGAYEKGFYAPLIGTIRTGKQGLSNQHNWGVVLPLPTTFFETHVHRRYLHFIIKDGNAKEYIFKSKISNKVSQFFVSLDQMFKPVKKGQSLCLKFYSL